MGLIDNFGRIIQTLIGVVALITAVGKGIPTLRKMLAEHYAKAADDQAQASRSSIGSASMMDLAFVLICAVFFSLLLVDALLISGRSVTNLVVSAAATLAITLTTTSSLVFAWRQGKSELGVGWWALLTLALVVVAPGGPFIKAESGSAKGISLWLSAPTLVFLIVSMWIYEYGHPLDKTITLMRRLQTTAVIVFSIAVATAAIGRQYEQVVLQDYRTPHFATGAGRELLASINNWNVAQQRIFYGITSEMYLVETYNQSANEFGIDNSSNSADSGSVQIFTSRINELEDVFETSVYGDLTQQLITEVASFFNDLGDQSKAIEFIDAPDSSAMMMAFLEEQGLTEESGYSREELRSLSQTIFRIYRQPPVANRRMRRMNQIVTLYNNLPPESKKSYLANRLKWIHPVGIADQDQPMIDLPGITAEARFNTLAIDRVRYALSTIKNQQSALINEFDYDSDVIQTQRDSVPGLGEPLTPEHPEIFLDLGTQHYVPRLREQLSLPVEFETALAFEEYQTFARSLVQSKFAEEQRQADPRKTDGAIREQVDNIFTSIDQLDSEPHQVFLHYLVNNPTDRETLYQALKDLLPMKVDLRPINNADDKATMLQNLRYMIDSEPPFSQDDPLTPIAQRIRSLQSEDALARIKALFQNENLEFPVYHLLDPQVLDLVGKLDQLSAARRGVILDVVHDPISYTMPELVPLLSETSVAQATPTATSSAEKAVLFKIQLVELIAAFARLDPTDQSGFLHQLAISLYRTQGSSSHNLFGLMVLQANQWSSGLFVAALICSPLVLLSAAAGAYAARRLSARDKLKALLVTEATKQELGRYEMGTTDLIRGRDQIIAQLKNLAGRGWSSIAIVGRRGVGKTRVLYQLMYTDRQQRPSTVTAWVSTPSKFDEEEFVESVLERLTADVEYTIAQRLGAKPLEVRRLESSATLIGMVLYGMFLIVLGLVFRGMWIRLPSDRIISTWVPILFVFVLSLIFLLIHVTRMQPIDLSPWLERNRSNSPHTVLLYREARQIRDFLEERRRAHLGRSASLQSTDYVRFGVILAAICTAMIAIAILINISPDLLLLVIAASFTVACLFLLRTRRVRITRGYSLMSLISTYRDFVERTVYRIKQGALGERHDDDFEVVVCIDELDKIVEPNELRTFLRRMKAIFEIPGAYYYLSLSEDALRSLYLGAAEGKNEIDSAFDHILPVAPVNCTVGEEIARSYLSKHCKTDQPSRLDRMIAAISYGVPRDIIRRCDEIIANNLIDSAEPGAVADELRRRQALVAHHEQLLTRQEYLRFSGSADETSKLLHAYFTHAPANQRTAHVLLSLWVLALLSILTTCMEDEWVNISEQLREIGYQIPEEQTEDVAEALRQIHDRIVETVTSRSPVSTPA